MTAALPSGILRECRGPNKSRAILVELPGHGDSDSLDGDLADWARAVLDSAPEHAAWVGWSLGAMLCIQAALSAPERIRRLVLVAGTPRFVNDRGILGMFGSSLVREPQSTMERFLSLQVRGADNAVPTLRRLRQGLRQRPDARQEALQQGLDFLLTVDLRDRLGDLRVPSLWLQGERDTLDYCRVSAGRCGGRSGHSAISSL